MKYGNIIYNKRNGRLNLGDDMQLLAIENLYYEMGIDYNDVVRIELSDLYSWDGEELIVPISFPFFSYNKNMLITCFSPKIYPVFLGLGVLSDVLKEEDIIYLNRFSPIGCRDYQTYTTMQKYNIPSYLFGCMTLTLPKKWSRNEYHKKVYCVDVSETLLDIIPEELKEDVEILTQVDNIDNLKISPEEKMRKIYNNIIENGKLVVTSRMHVALPCIAAGMPVIFAKDKSSYRFTGVNRIAKVYSREEYGEINWNVEPVEYDLEKQVMLNLAKLRVKNAFDEYNKIDYFESVLKPSVKEDGVFEALYTTERYLESQYNTQDSFSYAIWSITQTATLINEFIKRKWVNAKLVAVIDRAKIVEFDGIISEKKEKLLECKDAVVLVCSDAAIKEANKFLSENEIKKYYFCCQNDMPLL